VVAKHTAVMQKLHVPAITGVMCTI